MAADRNRSGRQQALGLLALAIGVGLAAATLDNSVVGWVIGLIRRRLDNPQVEITLSLATGYLAYAAVRLVTRRFY